MNAVLQMRNVSKAWGGLLVLRDVSLTVHSGEALALCGPSGVGKTTLASIAAGFEAADSGEVIRPSRISMVFQNPHSQFNPRRPLWASIGEVILNDYVDRGKVRAQVAEICTQLGVPGELVDAYPAQLSLGQLQRAALARAVVAQAELVICDEATSALDPLATKGVLDVMQELKARGAAILFITHDRAVARYLCEEILDLVPFGRLS